MAIYLLGVGAKLPDEARDPAIWVEKRVGFAYTLSMGNSRAWLLIAGMMLAPMIATRLLF